MAALTGQLPQVQPLFSAMHKSYCNTHFTDGESRPRAVQAQLTGTQLQVVGGSSESLPDTTYLGLPITQVGQEEGLGPIQLSHHITHL